MTLQRLTLILFCVFILACSERVSEFVQDTSGPSSSDKQFARERALEIANLAYSYTHTEYEEYQREVIKFARTDMKRVFEQALTHNLKRVVEQQEFSEFTADESGIEVEFAEIGSHFFDANSKKRGYYMTLTIPGELSKKTKDLYLHTDEVEIPVTFSLIKQGTQRTVELTSYGPPKITAYSKRGAKVETAKPEVQALSTWEELSDSDRQSVVDKAIELIELSNTYTPETFEQKQRETFDQSTEIFRRTGLQHLARRVKENEEYQGHNSFEPDMESLTTDARKFGKNIWATICVDGDSRYKNKNSPWRTRRAQQCAKMEVRIEDGQLVRELMSMTVRVY